MSFPSRLPAAENGAPRFRVNPLRLLQDVHAQFGDLVELTSDKALFSRLQTCSGCIAAFGPENLRTVFSRPDLFGMPVSLARRHHFPARLVKLNSGLFSMHGSEHLRHRSILAPMFDNRFVENICRTIPEVCETLLDTWILSSPLELLSEMRRLVLHIANRIVFGSASGEWPVLGALAQNLFLLRREYSNGDEEKRKRIRPDLFQTGNALDESLRDFIRHFRAYQSGGHHCFLSFMAQLRSEHGGFALTEDELVGHGNTLFMSTTEPLAVTLTWTLLVLSQFPALSKMLRTEIKQAAKLNEAADFQCLDLLGGVIREILRLFPPNAIMVRVTTQATSVLGPLLPQGCEILLSPFVAHRDPVCFPEPNAFHPGRWRNARPTPFQYLPFGGGNKICPGKGMASMILRIALALILRRYDVVLAGDQSIDWRMSITMMPANEPIVSIGSPTGDVGARSGRLLGPVAELVELGCDPVR